MIYNVYRGEHEALDLPLEIIPLVITNALMENPNEVIKVEILDYKNVWDEDDSPKSAWGIKQRKNLINTQVRATRNLIHQLKDIGFVYVQVGKAVVEYPGGIEKVNPTFLHVPHVDNSAIQIYTKYGEEEKITLYIKRASLGTILDNMTKNDFMVNEALGDIYKLSHLPGYKVIKKQLDQEIQAMKDNMERISEEANI